MGQYKKCYIFAGSPEAKCSGVEFDSSRYVICADGGYILAKKMGIEPDVIIGDFDTYKSRLPENLPWYGQVCLRLHRRSQYA